MQRCATVPLHPFAFDVPRWLVSRRCAFVGPIARVRAPAADSLIKELLLGLGESELSYGGHQ